MATLHNCSSDNPAAATGKVEPGLLRLPLELRQQIYANVFGSPRLFDLRHIKFGISPWSTHTAFRHMPGRRNKKPKEVLESDSPKSYDYEENGYVESPYKSFSVHIKYKWRTGILEVSKVISDEALDVLYGQNIFVVSLHAGNHHDLLKFGVANLRRIRYLRIEARPMGAFYGKPMVFDSQLWLPLLEGLQQLWIVALQPLAAGGTRGAPTLGEYLCQWTNWLDPIIEYFSIHLPKTTVIGLDDGRRAETRVIMNKHFHPGYLEVRTVTGDYHFERGMYSKELRYCDSDDSDESNAADGKVGQ